MNESQFTSMIWSIALLIFLGGLGLGFYIGSRRGYRLGWLAGLEQQGPSLLRLGRLEERRDQAIETGTGEAFLPPVYERTADGIVTEVAFRRAAR